MWGRARHRRQVIFAAGFGLLFDLGRLLEPVFALHLSNRHHDRVAPSALSGGAACPRASTQWRRAPSARPTRACSRRCCRTPRCGSGADLAAVTTLPPPVTRVVALGRLTFAALANPNYRRYFAGQATSLIGTWMQSVAQSWLVLQLTGSGPALGFVVGLQMLPVLVLGPYGGVVADRVDKRRLMVALQSAMGLLALTLGVLTVTGAVRIWHVYLLALLLGLTNAFENPARQSFVLEMVGPADLRNAVTLN